MNRISKGAGVRGKNIFLDQPPVYEDVQSFSSPLPPPDSLADSHHPGLRATSPTRRPKPLSDEWIAQMKLSLRRHVLFGVFVVIAALIAGLVAHPTTPPSCRRSAFIGSRQVVASSSPPRRQVAFTAPRRVVATSGICRIQVTAGWGMETTAGFVLGSMIWSIRPSFTNFSAKERSFCRVPWPSSLSSPGFLFKNGIGERNIPVTAVAFFPGCNQPIPLKAVEFSETADTVWYSFDTRRVRVSDPAIGTPIGSALGIMEQLKGGWKTGHGDQSTASKGQLLYRRKDRFYLMENPRGWQVFFDGPVPAPADAAPGTPIFDDMKQVVGIVTREGYVQPILAAMYDKEVVK